MRVDKIVFILFLVCFLSACGSDAANEDFAQSASDSGGSDEQQGQNLDSSLDSEARLTVKLFGSGDVSFQAENASQITQTCASDHEPCYRNYKVGSTITLTASAKKTNWRFVKWSGCDTATGTTCEVELEEDSVIHANFETKTITLHDDVHVLSPELDDALVSREGSVFVYESRLDEEMALTVGDVVVSTQDQGYARRVLSIDRFADRVYLETIQARVTDVVKNGAIVFDAQDIETQRDIALDFVPSTQKNVQFKPIANANGAKYRGDALVAAALRADTCESDLNRLVYRKYLKIDEEFNSFENSNLVLTLKGGTCIEATPEFGINIGLLSGVEEFHAAVQLVATSSLTATGTLGFPFSETVTIGRLQIGPLVASPLVFTIQADLSLLANGQGSANVQVETGDIRVRKLAGVAYDNGSWDSYGGSNQDKFDGERFNTSAEGTVDLEAGPQFGADVLLYGIVGPGIEVDNYAFARFEGAASNDENVIDFSGAFGAGITGRARARAAILGYTLAERQLELFNNEVIFFPQTVDNSKPFNPGAPTNIRVTRLSGDRIKLTWREPVLDGGAIPISGYSYTVFRNNIPAPRLQTGQSYYDAVPPGETVCYRVAAKPAVRSPVSTLVLNKSGEECFTNTAIETDMTAPSVPTIVSTNVLSTNAAHIDWRDSVDNTGGSGVAGYIIRRRVANQQEPARKLATTYNGTTRYVSTLLKPNAEYCYSVVAFDAEQNTSNPSEERCLSTLPPTQSEYVFQATCPTGEVQISSAVDLNDEIGKPIALTGKTSARLIGAQPQGGDSSGNGVKYVLSGDFDAGQNIFNGNLRIAGSGARSFCPTASPSSVERRGSFMINFNEPVPISNSPYSNFEGFRSVFMSTLSFNNGECGCSRASLFLYERNGR